MVAYNIEYCFFVAEGSSELEIATLTGNIIDGSQNAINGKELVGYIKTTAFIAALSIASTYFTSKMEETVTLRVRVKLWKKIMHLPIKFYDKDTEMSLSAA